LQKALPISATTKNAAFDDPHHPTRRVSPCHDGVSLPRAAEPASLWFAALPTTAAVANSSGSRRSDCGCDADPSLERRTRWRQPVFAQDRSDAADAALDTTAPQGAPSGRVHASRCDAEERRPSPSQIPRRRRRADARIAGAMAPPGRERPLLRADCGRDRSSLAGARRRRAAPQTTGLQPLRDRVARPLHPALAPLPRPRAEAKRRAHVPRQTGVVAGRAARQMLRRRRGMLFVLRDFYHAMAEWNPRT